MRTLKLYYRRDSKNAEEDGLYKDPACKERSESLILVKDGRQFLDWMPEKGEPRFTPVRLPALNLKWNTETSVKPGAIVDDGAGKNSPSSSLLAANLPEDSKSRDAVRAPKGKEVARDTSSEVAVVMGLLLKDGKWRSDASKRIDAFLQGLKVEGSKGVDRWLNQTLSGTYSPEDDAVLKALKLKTSDYGPRDVAALYYLLGAGKDVLAGEKEEPVRGILDEAAPPAKARMREQLVACLGRYTASGKPGDAEYCRKDEAGPLKAGSPEWMRAFCTEASITAFKIYDASKRNPALFKGELTAKPEKQEGVVAGGDGGGRQSLSAVDLSKPSDMAELFGKWGDVNVIHMPSREPKEGEDPTRVPGRTLAVVVRTMRTWEGDPKDPKARSVQQIGVYDISNPVDIYGKRFNMSADATNKFTLKEGGAEYVLKFSPQGEDVGISLERSDGIKPVYGHSGPPRLPTVNELFKQRAEKARDMGNLVDVGGRQYYVLGESAKQGALTFFSREMIEGMDRYSATDLVPDMVAYTNQKVDGRVERLGESVSLGKVGGQWYELRWNAEQGYWEPKAGRPPQMEAPPGTGATSPQSPSVPQEPAADEWPAFDLPNLGLRINSTNKDVAAINAALKAAGLAVRAYSCEPERAPYENFFLMHKSRLHVPVGFAGGKISKADFGGFELLGGTVLAVRDKTGAVYYDLKSEPEGWGDVWKAEGGGFDIGKGRSTWQGAARAEGIYIAVRDAAKASGLSAEVEDVIARVAKKVQEGAALEKIYKVGEGDKVFAKFAGRQSVEVWPNPGTSNPSQDVEGKPGEFVFEPIKVPPTAWDPKTGFADTLPMGELKLSRLKDPKFEKATAALYTAEKDGLRSTYIQFRIGKDDRSVSPVLVFQDAVDPSKDKDRVRIKYPGTAAIGIRGVKSSENPLQLCSPKKFDGRGLEAAGYIPVRDGPETGHGRFKGNLAGIAVWWGGGVTLEKALAKEGLSKEDARKLLAELP
ncbi:MAG: hypothetical protein WC728_13955 [Elusimicrobiota bacterium]